MLRQQLHNLQESHRYTLLIYVFMPPIYALIIVFSFIYS
jgi:hypothetical protein